MMGGIRRLIEEGEELEVLPGVVLIRLSRGVFKVVEVDHLGDALGRAFEKIAEATEGVPPEVIVLAKLHVDRHGPLLTLPIVLPVGHLVFRNEFLVGDASVRPDPGGEALPCDGSRMPVGPAEGVPLLLRQGA